MRTPAISCLVQPRMLEGFPKLTSTSPHSLKKALCGCDTESTFILLLPPQQLPRIWCKPPVGTGCFLDSLALGLVSGKACALQLPRWDFLSFPSFSLCLVRMGILGQSESPAPPQQSLHLYQSFIFINPCKQGIFIVSIPSSIYLFIVLL